MFECLVCNARAKDFRYGTSYVDPEEFLASLEELVFAR